MRMQKCGKNRSVNHNKHNRPKRRFAVALAAAACGLPLNKAAQATTRMWGTSGNTTTDWFTPGNWGGTAPVSGDDLVFGANGSSSTTLTNTLTYPSFVVNSITLSSTAPAYTMGGNNFTLGTSSGGTVLTNSSTSTETLSPTIFLGNAAQTVALTSGNITLSGLLLSLGSGSGFTLSGGHVLTVNGRIDGTVTTGNTSGESFTLSGTTIVGALTGGGSTGGGVALANNTLTVGDYNNLNSSFAGVISGTGTLVKAGNDTLTLTGANTYSSGGTVINSGTLDLGGGTSTGSLASAPLTLGGGALNVTRTGTNTQAFSSTALNVGASAINNSVSTDTVTLGAITEYRGATLNLVNTGAISTTTPNASLASIGGAQTILGGYAVVGGNTWAVSGSGATAGTITGLALANYNSSFVAGADVDTSGTTTPGALTINSLRFNTSGGATVNTAGNLVIATGGILETSAVGANPVSINNNQISSGSYFPGGNSGGDLIVTQNNTAGALTIGSVIPNNTFSIVRNGTTSSSSNQAVITGLSTTADYYIGMPISGTGIPANSVIIGIESPTSVRISNIATASATVSVTATGANGLVKSGPGTLVLSGANLYTGLTTIDAGTLALSSGNNRIASGGTVAFNGSGTFDVGSTSQTLAGITTTNTVNTAATIDGVGGTLAITTGAAIQQVFGPGGNIGASALVTTVDMSGLSNFSFNSTGGGIFRVGMRGGATTVGGVNPSTTLTLAASNTITASTLGVGDNDIGRDNGSATLNLGAANTIDADTITVGGDRNNATLDFANASSTATFRGTSGGSTAVGTWNIGTGFNLGNGNSQTWTDSVDLSNGSINAIVTNMTIGQVSLGGSGGRSCVLNASFTMGAGTATITTLNIGQTTSTAGSTYGGLLAANGTFTLNNAGGTLNATTINLATNTLVATNAANNPTPTVSGTFNLTNGTLAATTIQRGSQTNGVATPTTAFNWTNGTLENISGNNLAITSVPINLISGTHTFSASSASNGNITIDSASPISGAGGIVKTGLGVLTLAGTNAYTGGTTISAGTLLVNNSAGSGTGSGTVSLNAGTLGGIGSLTGDINAATTSSVTPGSGTAVGTLTTGNVNFAANSTLSINLNSDAASASLLKSNNAVSLGGVALLSVVDLSTTIGGTALAQSTVLPIITATGGVSGQFSGLTEGSFVTVTNGGNNVYTIDYQSNAVDLVVASPEPSCMALVGVAGLVLTRRRRTQRAIKVRQV